MAIPRSIAGTARLPTPRAHLAQPWGRWSWAGGRTNGTRRELIRVPSMPSSAGSSVIAVATAISTTTAAE